MHAEAGRQVIEKNAPPGDFGPQVGGSQHIVHA
jgi:hypothetical protein